MIVFFVLVLQSKNSPDKNNYQKVELDIPKEIAQIAKANSVNSFIFILQYMLIQIVLVIM